MRNLISAATLAAALSLTLVGGAMAQQRPEAEKVEKVEAAHAEVEKAEFKHGFGALAIMLPSVVGEPMENEHARPNGDTLQITNRGMMVWRKADNVPAFTNGAVTWVMGPMGLQVRGNDDRFEWEMEHMAGVDLRGDGSVDDNLPSHSGLDDMADGVKLRGDGTVDDGLPRHSGLDDSPDGMGLRGDGTVDDGLPRHSGLDDTVGGVKLRGDGTVDDNSAPRQSAQPSSAPTPAPARSSDDGGASGRSSGGSDDSGGSRGGGGDSGGSRGGDDGGSSGRGR